MLILGIVILILVVLAVIVSFRTIGFVHAEEETVPMDIPSGTEGADKLAEAVRLKTISYIDPAKTDWGEFEKFHALLEKQFPLFHGQCEKTVVNGYSLVYRWPAKAGGSAAKPALITAHMDVVPVESGTENDWKHEPFSGELAEGRIWGRGTLDTKAHIICAMEAAEKLIKEGFTPPRDVYFAFGHDEETGGKEGAVKIAVHFHQQGIAFDFVLDEGGCVVEGALDGVEPPLALIGVGEKGYADIRIKVSGDGGHSSMPPKHTSLGLLAQAICLLEEKKHKIRLIAPVKEFLLTVGPEMGLFNRIILANLWLFKPLFLLIFSGTKAGSAMTRTTTAVTMAQGSPAPNIIPQNAEAVVNFRLMPGETCKELLDFIRKTCKGIPITLEPITLDDPSLVSSTGSQGYGMIRTAAKKVFGDAIVTPYLMMGSSDARKYEPVCESIYRFTPYHIQNEELSAIHGTNESITVDNVNRCTAFFGELYKGL